MLRGLFRLIVVVFALVGGVAAAAGLVLMRGGISARHDPTRLEATLARRVRSIAIPRTHRNLANPVPESDQAVEDGLAHFADHCAMCHGNDGSGQTEMGKGLYPRVPDMRQAATQNLTDGELFYIIENGVKLTGMPAWGDGSPESARASWHLVHFIRRLPHLTQADLDRMSALNPKSPDEWRELQAPGPEAARKPKPAPPHRHKH